MTDTFVALGFAIFIWWFSTGIVILLNRMSRTAVTMSLVISSALGLGALAGLSHTALRFHLCLVSLGLERVNFSHRLDHRPAKNGYLKKHFRLA
ncbi:MAG: hypothetical protein RL659_1303 [Pseudomonadota bacterium]